MKTSDHDSSWEILSRGLAGRKNLLGELSSLVDRAEDVDLSAFLEQIDESDYWAEDWAEALIVFDSWLDENSISERPFREMVGYVHCCTLMNAPQLSLPALKVIVFQSLVEFGFDAAKRFQR